jgi:hypothetical protein
MSSRDLLFRSLLVSDAAWLLPDVDADAAALSEAAVLEAALSAAEAEAEEAAALVEEVLPVLPPQAVKSMDMPRAAAVMAANCLFIFIQIPPLFFLKILLSRTGLL